MFTPAQAKPSDSLEIVRCDQLSMLAALSAFPLPDETHGGSHVEAEQQIQRIERELSRSTAGTQPQTTGFWAAAP